MGFQGRSIPSISAPSGLKGEQEREARQQVDRSGVADLRDMTFKPPPWMRQLGNPGGRTGLVPREGRFREAAPLETSPSSHVPTP